jgi:hypothetical protein
VFLSVPSVVFLSQAPAGVQRRAKAFVRTAALLRAGSGGIYEKNSPYGLLMWSGADG